MINTGIKDTHHLKKGAQERDQGIQQRVRGVRGRKPRAGGQCVVPHMSKFSDDIQRAIKDLEALHATMQSAVDKKLMTATDMAKTMRFEKAKLKALINGKPQPVGTDEAGIGGTMAGGMDTSETPVKNAWPCANAADVAVAQHFSTFQLGREAIMQAIEDSTLFSDLENISTHLVERCKGKKGGSGVPKRGVLDWEFDNGYALR